MIRLLPVILLILSLCPSAGAAEYQVQPGISYRTFMKKFSAKAPIRVHVLVVDINRSSIEVKAALARGTVGRLLPTSKIAYANGAAAAVNGTFFHRRWPYLPIGLIVIDGKMMTKSLLNRSAIGISRSKKVRFGIPKMVGRIVNVSNNDTADIFGINRPRKNNELIIYTPEYGNTTKTEGNGVEMMVENDIVIGIGEQDCAIPKEGYVISCSGWNRHFANQLPPGSRIKTEMRLTDGWDEYEQVITGGPRLLDNGEIVTDLSLDIENFWTLAGRNARTAIGRTDRNKLILAVVEGKKPRRRVRRSGVTFRELAVLMKELGCKDAIGLDGGGSSTMYVGGRVVNNPQDGNQERVSNAVVILAYE